MRALLDTSVLVAGEHGPVFEGGPDVDQTEISVVTLAELTIGVLVATDEHRPRRLATLSLVETTWRPIPVDANVARTFAHIVAQLRYDRRKIPVLDALIAATAMTEDIPVVTRNRDFSAIAGLKVVRV